MRFRLNKNVLLQEWNNVYSLRKCSVLTKDNLRAVSVYRKWVESLSSSAEVFQQAETSINGFFLQSWGNSLDSSRSGICISSK